jgi:beta-1,2-mannobiose phosphorylase / 1,2-beta-oligomannan phosphorylase
MASIALPKTKDFRSYTRLGIITSEGSDNKDLIIFPEKINQKYVFLRRPRTWVGPKFDVDKPSIWIGEGDILSNFDKHSLLMKPEQECEECEARLLMFT